MKFEQVKQRVQQAQESFREVIENIESIKGREEAELVAAIASNGSNTAALMTLMSAYGVPEKVQELMIDEHGNTVMKLAAMVMDRMGKNEAQQLETVDLAFGLIKRNVMLLNEMNARG